MTTWSKVAAELKALYHDEQGAEGLEKLLIIGAIVLPLLALLLLFRGSITEWLTDSWETMRDDADDTSLPTSLP